MTYIQYEVLLCAWIHPRHTGMLSHTAKQLRSTAKHASQFITNLKTPRVMHQSAEKCDRAQHPPHPPLSMSWKAGGNEGEGNMGVCVYVFISWWGPNYPNK